MNLYPRLGSSTPFDPSHGHVTSPVLRPFALAFVRLVLALYTLVTLVVNLVWDGGSFFSYFTHLSYIGLCAYFFAAGVQTLSFAFSLSRRARANLSPVSYPLQKWPRALQVLHVLLETTITTYPLVVTIVFWTLLSSSSVFADIESAWSNTSLHILNLVFSFFEILLTNIPPAPWLTLPCSILLLAFYLALAYVSHATQGFYPYDFLDPETQHSLLAAYILGILGGYIIIFVLVRFFVLSRMRLVAWHRWRRSDSAEHAGEQEAIDEWEAIEKPDGKDKDGVV